VVLGEETTVDDVGDVGACAGVAFEERFVQIHHGGTRRTVVGRLALMAFRYLDPLERAAFGLLNVQDATIRCANSRGDGLPGSERHARYDSGLEA